jgi:glyoxylase-like metal-dependent hydrolase (beta-lactamase superfamily II)
MHSLNRRHFLGTASAALGAAALPRALAADSAPAGKPKAINNPFVYKFHIGEIEAWSISDGHLLFGGGVNLMWPPDQRPAMIKDLEAHGERTDGIPLYVNVLLLRLGNEIVLCDAGNGIRPNNTNMGWLWDGLKSINITPDQVTKGILSHGHSDHIGGFAHAGKALFPNAAIHVLKEEIDFWRAPKPDFSKSHRGDDIPGMIKNVRESLDVLQPNLQPNRSGDQLLNGAITIESAPGHTDGHCVLRIKNGKESLLHLMDLAHNHLLMFTDPNWFIEFDHHPALAVATRKAVFGKAAETRERCYGFHVPWPGLGHILPKGAGFKWEQERISWGS